MRIAEGKQTQLTTDGLPQYECEDKPRRCNLRDRDFGGEGGGEKELCDRFEEAHELLPLMDIHSPTAHTLIAFLRLQPRTLTHPSLSSPDTKTPPSFL
jgi:hypothetical protein